MVECCRCFRMHKSACLLSRFLPCYHTRKQQAQNYIMSTNHYVRPRTHPHDLLGLNGKYLFNLGSPKVFMDSDEVMEYINSVSSFLQDWYDHCLSKPENQHHLQRVRNNVDAFIKDMHLATEEQHMLARKGQKIVYCPSHDLFRAKDSGSLGFRHYSAATVCLIARYGIRGGGFANNNDEGAWHLAAIMVLVTVILDLKNGDYFASQFKKNAQAVADAQARKSALSQADSAVATLAQQLHALTMQSDNGFRPEDELVEAMRLGLSSINLSK